MIYSCDFETSKDDLENPTETWVYLWGSMEIESESFRYGRTIKEFIDYVFNELKNNDTLYFHNLKFDGSFILNYILNNKDYYLLLRDKDYYGWNTIKKNNPKIKLLEALENRRFLDSKGFKEDLVNFGFTDKKGKGLKDCVFIKGNINSMGIWYSMEMRILKKGEKIKTVKIFDSLKLLNYKVETIASDFLSIKGYEKLDYDYDKIRKSDDELEEHDVDYIKRDCEIVARALNVLKSEYSITKNTAASASLENFKKTINRIVDKDEDRFRELFPVLDYKHDVERKNETETDFAYRSYKGGIVYVNPKIKDRLIETKNPKEPIGMTLDANSLYPSVMTNENNVFPYGKGVYFKGKYKKNDEYPLFIQRFICQFKLKDQKMPMVSLKNRDFIGNNENIEIEYNELLESSNYQWVELTLNSVDFELFLDSYEIITDFDGNEMIEYIDGYMYKGMTNIFNDYMEYWREKKAEAVRLKNDTMKNVAKIFLNSLYGKFGTKSDNVKTKIPYIDNGVLKFISSNPEDEEPVYMPMASFITGYARKELIRMYNLVVKVGHEVYGDDYYNCFCYCDTDSLHCLLSDKDIEGTELEEYIDDGTKFGYWKKETDIYRAKYIRPKTYLEQIFSDGYVKWYKELDEEYIKNNKVKYYYVCACAGLPKDRRKELNFDSFEIGTVFECVKLVPKQVKGGVVLVESNFEIKDNKAKKHKGGN